MLLLLGEAAAAAGRRQGFDCGYPTAARPEAAADPPRAMPADAGSDKQESPAGLTRPFGQPPPSPVATHHFPSGRQTAPTEQRSNGRPSRDGGRRAARLKIKSERERPPPPNPFREEDVLSDPE
uniref:Uncharacterized protein n=1 Tax=Rangifer tarandus platyrhynchus TaxID=3082113 RepID=A0ACB0FDT7_RANTA|nr:unnamed protein product [Rangifer tarandus platyrhynchus]